MIAVDRPQIGALMALGYQHGRLLAAYLEAMLILGLVGGLLGLAGSLLVRSVFAHVSASSMGMPEIPMLIDAPTIARALAWQVAGGVGGAAPPGLRPPPPPPPGGDFPP